MLIRLIYLDFSNLLPVCSLPLAATGSVDGTVSIWDVQTQRLRATLSHEDAVVKAKFVKNSPMLATCSADRTVKMWDARTGQCVKSWSGHRDTVLDIAVAEYVC